MINLEERVVNQVAFTSQGMTTNRYDMAEVLAAPVSSLGRIDFSSKRRLRRYRNSAK